MTQILSVLWEWRFVVLLILGAVIYCIAEWQKAKAILYSLMLQAKRYAKDQILKSGKQQEDYVVRMALQHLPLSLKIFLSEDLIRKIVKWLYSKLADYLDDGVMNGSFTTKA